MGGAARDAAACVLLRLHLGDDIHTRRSEAPSEAEPIYTRRTGRYLVYLLIDRPLAALYLVEGAYGSSLGGRRLSDTG